MPCDSSRWFEVSKVDGYVENLYWERHTTIKGWLGCRGIDLLGVYFSDGEMWSSTGPMKAFDTYIGSEDYPRMLIIRGPHPFSTCSCAVCGPARERLDRARAAAAEREENV